MSRSRRRLDEMRQVMALRAVGAKVAEARAVEAQRDLAEAREEARLREQALQETIQSWQASLQVDRFDPMTSGFWGRAVNDGVVQVTHAEDKKKHSESARDWARAQMSKATAYERCAQTLLNKARSHYAREIERKQDDERADHTTRKFIWL